MKRAEMLSRIRGRSEPWDIAVVGGGATGVGIAVDAASRGYQVALFEQSDLGKGTSSRSTKLIHGGVRYLQSGNVSLVMEALKERGILRRNAPHLVHDLAFVVPNYDWWEAPFYGVGLKLYDVLAGRYGFGKSKHLSVDKTIERIPTVETGRLRGGTVYFDVQFDDARLLINLAQTAVEQGATVTNYCKIVRLRKDAEGLVSGVVARDLESGAEHDVRAKVVVNATGAYTD
ncbi:MAG: FAD-dependent oxidoreductase, partial [Myxococcales bacterium]